MMKRQSCGTEEGMKLWCNLDFCGLLTFEIGEIVLFFAIVFISRAIIPTVFHNAVLREMHYVTAFLIYGLAVVSHFRSCFTDPGTVPKNATYLESASEEERQAYCTKCNSFKPYRAHHCSECNRCIVRMDHHCPWINNCVGYRNMKYFILFMGYVCLMCIFTFYMDCMRLYYSYYHSEEERTTTIVCVMLTMSLSCLFGAFCGSMLQDAFMSIKTNTTSIDRLKGQSFAGEGEGGFKDYFGNYEVNRFMWFLPVAPRYRYVEEIRGFRIALDV